MDTKYGIVNDGSQRKIVKYVSAVPPNIQRTIFPKALVIETIDLSNLPTFVISSDKSYHVGISYFIGQQQQESFYAIKTTIHEIS